MYMYIHIYIYALSTYVHFAQKLAVSSFPEQSITTGKLLEITVEKLVCIIYWHPPAYKHQLISTRILLNRRIFKSTAYPTSPAPAPTNFISHLFPLHA